MMALREQRQAVDPGIQVARLPAGPVVRMEPIPDGSTFAASALAAPVQVASLGNGSVVRMDPIPDGSTAEGAAAMRSAENRGAASALAPPRPAAVSAPTQQRGLGLLGTAHASALPPSLRANAARPMASPAASPGAWAVQVGAFASQNLARNAANTARMSGAPTGRVLVQPVVAGRSTLYRARVTGLSQSAAQAVCDRLRRNGACMVLSPDAQS
jgi:cell division septation protein DedD